MLNTPLLTPSWQVPPALLTFKRHLPVTRADVLYLFTKKVGGQNCRGNLPGWRRWDARGDMREDIDFKGADIELDGSHHRCLPWPRGIKKKIITNFLCLLWYVGWLKPFRLENTTEDYLSTYIHTVSSRSNPWFRLRFTSNLLAGTFYEPGCTHAYLTIAIFASVILPGETFASAFFKKSWINPCK